MGVGGRTDRATALLQSHAALSLWSLQWLRVGVLYPGSPARDGRNDLARGMTFAGSVLGACCFQLVEASEGQFASHHYVALGKLLNFPSLFPHLYKGYSQYYWMLNVDACGGQLKKTGLKINPRFCHMVGSGNTSSPQMFHFSLIGVAFVCVFKIAF